MIGTEDAVGIIEVDPGQLLDLDLDHGRGLTHDQGHLDHDLDLALAQDLGHVRDRGPILVDLVVPPHRENGKKMGLLLDLSHQTTKPVRTAQKVKKDITTGHIHNSVGKTIMLIIVKSRLTTMVRDILPKTRTTIRKMNKGMKNLRGNG